MAETKTPTVTDPKATHTPLPWQVNHTPDNRHWIMRGDDKSWPIARCEIDFSTKSVDIAQANAEFIVRAVNSHQDLLDALNKAIAYLANPQAFDTDELGKEWWRLKTKAERHAE